MRKTQKHLFVVNNGAFPFDTLVAVGCTDKEICHFLKKRIGYEMDEEDKEAVKMRGVGRTVMLGNGATILRLAPRQSKSAFVATLAHEAFHATVFLFDRVGIRLTDDSDEVFAYHIQHLTEQILNKLWK